MKAIQPPRGGPKTSAWRIPLICAALALLTFAVFGPAMTHDFITFDDDVYVYDNPVVAQGLTLRGLVWAFSFHAYNWHPLTWVSHMLDCQIYGLRPWGHHLTNILLHVAAVVALFQMLRSLTGAVWRSALVAAVFAVHPLRVESVAWVAERKDVLSGLFFVLTVGAYARYARRLKSGPAHRQKDYAVVVFFYLLGLMSKPMLVTLPVVLLLLDYWPLRRPERAWKLVLEKVPLLFLSAAGGVATLLAQTNAIQSARAFPLGLRAANALAACALYLRQMVWPSGLALFYPHPRAFPSWELAAAVVVVAGFSAAALVWRRSRPWIFMGWSWYLVMLLPVLGIIQVGGQAHADRYTYLPQIGLYIALAWEVGAWLRAPFAAALIGGIIGLLLLGTWKQDAYWKNSETLWSRSLDCTTNNEIAHYGLGNAYRAAGELDAALVQYQAALALAPDYADALNNLGVVLQAQGRLDEAAAEYRLALASEPAYAPAHYNLASTLLKEKKPEEAIAEFQQALQLKPDYVAAWYNLGLALLQTGQADQAIGRFEGALRLDPTAAEIHNNLGNALLETGRVDRAVAQFQETLRLNPSLPSPHLNLGNALLQQGALDAAMDQFQQALKINPSYAAAHYNLGNALAQKGQTAAAISQYEKSLALSPADPEVQNNLAWILATAPEASVRDGARALALASQANRAAGGQNAVILHTVAAALAQTGQWEKARRTDEQALQIARASGQKELQEQLATELKHYQARQSFHP